LISHCPKNRVAFWEHGAVDGIQRLFLSGDALVMKDAGKALAELLNGFECASATGHAREKVFSHANFEEAMQLVVQGFVRRLACDVDFIKWTDLQQNVAGAMLKVSAIKSEGGIDVCSQWAADAMRQLLQSPDATVQLQAATAIVIFCHTPMHCQDAFRVAGCVPLLRDMLLSPSTAMQSTTAAIELLRDCAQDSCMHATSMEHMRRVGGVVITRLDSGGGTHLDSGGGFAALDYTLQFHNFDTFVADIALCNGCFYFEVEILTLNLYVQFGFCTHGFEPCRGHAGVGDDASSWGVCGRRLQAFHGGKNSVFGSNWSAGDIIGFALDMRTARAAIMSISINGTFAAPNGAAFNNISAHSLSPAFSGSCDRCRLNFGDRPFAHAPPDNGVYVSLHNFQRLKTATSVPQELPSGIQEKEYSQHVKQCLIS
jgi:hypothetical protein